jgi:hypothetical protein
VADLSPSVNLQFKLCLLLGAIPCANTSMTRHKYIPIASTTASLLSKVIAVFTPESLPLRFWLVGCDPFI